MRDSIAPLEPRIKVPRSDSSAHAAKKPPKVSLGTSTKAPPEPAEKTALRGGEAAPQRPTSEDPAPPDPGANPPKVVVAPPDQDVPKFGEYVYVEELPEALVKVPPAYPDAAREAHVEGTVMIQALIGRDGMVKDTKVVKSVPGLDDAAASAVRQWQFKPAMAKGAPVATWVAIPVKFSIH
jgi:protein TonB